MSDHDTHSALRRRPYVEGSNYSVHAGCCDETRIVLVPIVGKGFGRGSVLGDLPTETRLNWSMNRDGQRKVIGNAGGCSEVKDAEMGIRGDGREDRRRVGREGGRVGARVRREREEGFVAMGCPLSSISFDHMLRR